MSNSWDDYGRGRSRDDHDRRGVYGERRDTYYDDRSGSYGLQADRDPRRGYVDSASGGRSYGYDRPARDDYGYDRDAYRRSEAYGYGDTYRGSRAATEGTSRYDRSYSRFDPSVHYSDRDANRAGERSLFERAGDEVASWFGDEDAERRREADKRHAGRGPKNYTRSDDRIHDDVNDRLTDDHYIDASDVEVTVRDREVTLSGVVQTRDQKRRAEDVAERVSGVTHVQNNLRVQREMGSAGLFGSSDAAASSYGERGTPTTVTGLGRTTINE